MGDNHTGSTAMFGIFVVTIFSLVLFPYTIYHFCCSEDEGAVQPWSEKSKKKKTSWAASLQKMCTKGNLIVLALWAAWFLLLWWVSVSVSDMKPFDPFEILEIERGATDKEIKKAYRQLSLKFHPDKNPDPKAANYFAMYITKAHQALTDEASKANYEKYGHPDGPQALNVGVALPEWIFPTDKKAAPMILLALVGCGILLPLFVVSWYMLSSNKFAGPNHIMQETLQFYFHSKYSIKESQSLVRIPETLVCAMEFIIMHTPSEQTAALDELRRLVLRANPDLKDKTLFWKRKASVLKAHMLLLAYLDRESNIPLNLQLDLRFVLQKSPVLLEEMLKIAAALPRAPHGYAWLTPSMAVVEMMQCLSQAMPVTIRKPPSGKPADLAAAALLQLPHFDGDVLKKLKRKKINTLKELAELSAEERSEALLSAGLSAAQVEEASTLMAALPTIQLRATCLVEGEDEIMEQDMSKCKIRVVLTRPSHKSESFQMPGGKTVRACTPLFPHPKDEQWHFFLTDPSTNSVLGWAKATLMEAETFGFEHPELVDDWSSATGVAAAAAGDAAKALVPAEARVEDGKPVTKALATAAKFINRYNSKQLKGGANGVAGGGDAAAEALNPDEAGQLIEVPFLAPIRAGKYELQVVAMCDSYVGSDRTVVVKMKVSPMTRAVMEGRDARSQQKIKQWESDDEEDKEDKGDKDAGKEDDDSEEDEESEGDDYDSDETGELETGDEDSEDGEDEASNDGEEGEGTQENSANKKGN